MTRKLIIILPIIFLIGCTKPYHGYSELVFRVPKNIPTKTHLVPDAPNRLFDVVWDNGDQVKVYDENDGEGIYTNTGEYEDDNHEVAHFGGDGVDVSGTITAFYPVSIANGSNRFVLPYEQILRTRNDGYMYNYPMWAQESGGNHVWFRNLTGILILRVRGHAGAQIRRIYIKEPADPHGVGLRGTYDVLCNGSTHTNEPSVVPVSPLYDITLDCSSHPVTLSSDESSLFYFSGQKDNDVSCRI